jgi:hypothetical protein
VVSFDRPHHTIEEIPFDSAQQIASFFVVAAHPITTVYLCSVIPSSVLETGNTIIPMRFLLHPIRRSAQANNALGVSKRAADTSKKGTLTSSMSMPSKSPGMLSSTPSMKVNESSNYRSNITSNNNDKGKMTKSWGQQCSPNCGCVLRFETTIDQKSKEIVSAHYIAKIVMTKFDKDTKRLEPIYTTRTQRPMVQDCTCPSLHTLAQEVISYLPNKRLDQIQNMNQFSTTRSSPAFRHAVLAEHNLPRSNRHCFDVVEEAFCGVIEGSVPTKRRLDADYNKILTAEYLHRPLVVHCTQTKQTQLLSEHHGGRRDASRRDRGYNTNSTIVSSSSSSKGSRNNGSIGMDRNKLSMTTPRTASTLRMFDINSDHWDEEEYAERVSTYKSNGIRYDWVSYIDKKYENEESA